MAKDPVKAMLAVHVPADLANRFRAWARERDGSTAAALRRLITQTVDGAAPPPPRGVGTGVQVGVRLKRTERAALAEAAKARGVTPANWLRSLALVHLARRPQWSPAELTELRHLFRELRRIADDVDQIARQADTAAGVGLCSAASARQARDAAEMIRGEMQRLVAVMTGHFTSWNLPGGDVPMRAASDAAPRSPDARPRRRPRARPPGQP